MKKNLTIWCNPILLVSGIVMLTFTLALCSIPFLFPGLMRYKTEANEIGTKWIAAILGTSMVAALISCMPQWVAKIKLGQDGVCLFVAFKKTIQTPYNSYPYVFYAQYFQMGLIPVIYLVFSKKQLTLYEQEHINRVPISDETIKLRYRKRAFRKLLQILPQEYQNKHKTVFVKFDDIVR